MTDNLGFVHRFLPASNPDSRETLLVLHGTGGDENDLIGIAQSIAPGAAILSPRGNVLENGAPRFFKRLAEGVFDPLEVRSRGEELARFIRAAIATYGLDAGHVFAFGFSNGANIASTVMFLAPTLLQGSMLFRPMVVFEPDAIPDLSGKGVFISSGRVDPIVPTDHVERLVELFKSSGAEVTLKWQPGGHRLSPGEVHEAAEWLALQRARV
jgi:phospholipase/carboxylesterase